MILYEENPNIKDKIVKTINNKDEYRRNCIYRLSNKKYYVKNKDCFLIENHWYRTDSEHVIFDEETKTWTLRKNIPKMKKGFVRFEKGNPVIGFFSKNPYTNVIVRLRNGEVIYSINSQILLENGYFEDIANLIWLKTSDYKKEDISYYSSIRNERNFHDRGYNIEDNSVDYSIKCDLYEKYPLVVSKKAKDLSKYLGNLTFGLEIETSQGNLCDTIQSRHGLVICRDGSISGAEFVTIPLTGAKGLQNVDSVCSELSARTLIDLGCSVHVHFGNIRRDKLFIAAFYTLSRKIQNELFTMFPYYKTNHKGVKKKNYTQKLPKLGIYPLVEKNKESFDAYLSDVHVRLFDFLCDNTIPISKFNKKTREHPVRNKWDQHNRLTKSTAYLKQEEFKGYLN